MGSKKRLTSSNPQMQTSSFASERTLGGEFPANLKPLTLPEPCSGEALSFMSHSSPVHSVPGCLREALCAWTQ